ASAAPTRTFLGSHPRNAHVPPNGLESTTATCHPAARQRWATADAAVPVPIAITSNFLVTLSLPSRRGCCQQVRLVANNQTRASGNRSCGTPICHHRVQIAVVCDELSCAILS